MTFGLQQFITMLLVCIIGYGIISCYDKTRKIYCTFKARDRTEISKFSKRNQEKIIFKGSDGIERWYDVDPARTTLKLIDKGIHVLFPIFVRCSTYKEDSRYPEDPFTFRNTMDDDPSIRKLLNAKDDAQEFAQQTERGFGGGKVKTSFLQQWMPVIVIIGFAVMGYFIWDIAGKTDRVGFALNVVQQQLGDLLKR